MLIKNYENNVLNAVNIRHAILREEIAKEFIEKERNEKKMLADLVYNLVETNHITEFSSNIFYVDGEKRILYPTVAECYATDGKMATIVTPSIKKSGKRGNLSIIKTSENKPFGEYSRLMTPAMIKKIKEAECFIVSEDMPNMDVMFKSVAGMGIPCVYLVNGKLDKEIKRHDDKVRHFMKSLTDNNKLMVESNFYYNNESNTLGKAYVLKR